MCCGYLQNHFMWQFCIGFVPKVLLLDLSVCIQIQRGYNKLARNKFETLCWVHYISVVTLALNVVSLESLFISLSNHVLYLKIMHFFSFPFCYTTVRLFSWY